jgi:hypothetical protein
MFKKITLFVALTLSMGNAFAGNPDRQGEAGAYELLINPWARTSGLANMGVSYITGAEAVGLNPAGLARMSGDLEIGLSHAIYLKGTGLGMNALAVGFRLGENSAMAVSLNAMSFGDIQVTTINQPEGTGATYSPRFVNVGLSYATVFDKKVSVGVTLRGISESITDVSASGFSLDAGVQYMSGSKEYPERFKFGIALRNIGSNMQFGGQGLNSSITNTANTNNYKIAYAANAAGFQLPSQLHIGFGYDLLPKEATKLTFIANFTSNAFSKDDIGAGLELGINKFFAIRAGYKTELNSGASSTTTYINNVYTGPSGGVSFQLPIDKEKKTGLFLDYGYQPTNPWSGTHTLSLRVGL